MNVTIFTIGSLASLHEKNLSGFYLERLKKICSNLSIRSVTTKELRVRKNSKPLEQTALMLKNISSDMLVVALDEKGDTLSSMEFAQKISKWREQGCQSVAFLIGGAEGHAPEIFTRAAMSLSMSKMTWPHSLARIMLYEQLYRSILILNGHPYHKDG